MRFDYPASGIVQPREFIEACAAQLATNAIFVSALGSAANIYPHRTPPARPSGLGWVVVRELAFAGGGAADQTAGLQRVTIQVMSECPMSTSDPDRWHSAVQNRVIETLLDAGFSPTLTLSEVAIPLARTRAASPPVHDRETDTLYATSEYRVVLAAYGSGTPVSSTPCETTFTPYFFLMGA